MVIHKICIVGGGNISNTRHIPAIKISGRADIVGIVGKTEKDLLRTAHQHGIQQGIVFSEDALINTKWLKEVDLAVIGVPPREHYQIAKAFLRLGKNILLEKPMTMAVNEAEELVKLASDSGLQICVMHNFQFANNFMKLEKMINANMIGDILSFHEIQYTNNTRRLPAWYNDLPLGLFYDEAAHFFYLLEKLAGKVTVINSFAYHQEDRTQNTPRIINVNMLAGNFPATLSLNFQSPICEWYFIVSGTKSLAVYDFFRDILITVPNDGLHLASNVISTSLHLTIKHWLGTVQNGIQMMRGHLLYGHDRVINLVLDSIESGKSPEFIDGKQGLRNVSLLNEVVEKTTWIDK